MSIMPLYPKLPDGLGTDLASSHEIVIHWNDGHGDKREIGHSAASEDPDAFIGIVFRPFIVVGKRNNEGVLTIVESIPLESVTAIDVDDSEPRVNPEDGNFLDWDEIPICRWVRHPQRGLLRFTA